MYISHRSEPFRNVLAMVLVVLMFSLCSAQTDPAAEHVAQRLKELVSTPAIPQSQLDSLSERLIYLNNLNGVTSDEACVEIALLKAEIAHATMNGGRSLHMNKLLIDESSCIPHHGLYDFMLGGIAYNTGQFNLAADKYRSALDALGIEDRASVMIQLNLSAALEAANRPSEAIDSLYAMLNGEHWKTAPGIVHGKYTPQIAVNAAAMLVTEKRYAQSLDVLDAVDASSLSEYWRVIQLSNEYIALSRLARFDACDSLWTTTLQHLPFKDLPLPMFEHTLGSWLATDSYAYVELLSLEEDILAQLLEQDESVLSALLAPHLSDAARKQHWEILKAANQLERAHMTNLAASHHQTSTKSVELEGILKQLSSQQQIAFRWQWAAGLLVIILVIAASSWAYFKRKAYHEIQTGIQQAKSQRPTVSASKLDITKADIRKIHMGLTKGHKIGEALLSLQKVEIIHNSTSSPLSPASLQTIKGIEDLSESEFNILQLSLEGIPNKEIAHQLQVSSGYIYNSRSAIRKKLGIPKELSIRNWIEHQTT